MSTIDPVEAALAVIGVEPILSKEVEKVRLADVKLMESLGKRASAEAKRIVHGDSASVPLTAVPYKKYLKLLFDEYNIGQLEAMVAAFPEALHDISGEFLIKSQKVVELLRALFPQAQKQTLLGPENILPPALAIRKFATLLDVVNDPMRVFGHLACGSLLKSQAVVMREVYPTFSEYVTDALKEAATDAKAAKKSFRLPPRLQIGYGTWQGIPQVNPRLATRLQKNFENADKEQPKPAGQEGTSTSVAAKAAMTNTQHSLYPQSVKG